MIFIKLEFNLRQYLKRIYIIVLIFFLCGQVAAQERQADVARLGTSSVGSTFYVIANGLGNLMRLHAGINMTVEPIGGSYANVFGLNAGKIDYAVTNAGAAYEGFNGIYPFEHQSDLRLIAQGQSSYRFILTRKKERIESIKDLEGMIFIGRRPALPEMEKISRALLTVANLNKVNLVSTKNTKETLRHLKSGTVDAAIIPGGARLAAIAQLFRDDLVDPLYIPDSVIQQMQINLPPYMYTQLFPAGHFQGQQKPFTVFGLNTYLVAGPHVSDEQVYSIIKTLFEHHEEFLSYHNAARQWTIENTLNDPKIPFHNGAIRYFKEIGRWTNNLETLQTQLAIDRSH
jgi:uncharacterized protein